MSGPYETQEERERRELKADKKRWVSPEGFTSVFTSGRRPNFIENYVTRDPSDPPVLHQFRSEDKGKWIAGGFVV